MSKDLKDYLNDYTNEYLTINYVKKQGEFNFKKDEIKYSSRYILLSTIAEFLEKGIRSNDITIDDIDKIKKLIKYKLGME